MTNRRRNSVLNQEGQVLIGSALIGALFLSLGVASLMYCERDLKGTTQFRRGKQTMATAESGALHGLGIINAKMLRDFKTEIVDQWNSSPDLLGSSAQKFPLIAGAEYTVDVEADPADPISSGIIESRARDAGGERSGVRIRVRSRFSFKWGAIYLANDIVHSTFHGNSLDIDGTNYRAFATNAAGDGLEVPGIGTRSGEATSNLRSEVREQQMDNVRGMGPEPSILNLGGPTPEDMKNITEAILDLGNHVIYRPNGGDGGNLAGNLVMGTIGAPQVSYVQNVSKVTGNVEGSGILIIDSDVELQGNITWTGWILINGSLSLKGSAMVQGTVWASEVDFSAGGDMTAHFCIECIQLATDDINLDLLPSKVTAIAWEELPWNEL